MPGPRTEAQVPSVEPSRAAPPRLLPAMRILRVAAKEPFTPGHTNRSTWQSIQPPPHPKPVSLAPVPPPVNSFCAGALCDPPDSPHPIPLLSEPIPPPCPLAGASVVSASGRTLNQPGPSEWGRLAPALPIGPALLCDSANDHLTGWPTIRDESRSMVGSVALASEFPASSAICTLLVVQTESGACKSMPGWLARFGGQERASGAKRANGESCGWSSRLRFLNGRERQGGLRSAHATFSKVDNAQEQPGARCSWRKGCSACAMLVAPR